MILTQAATWAASAGDPALEEGIRLQLAAHEVYEGTRGDRGASARRTGRGRRCSARRATTTRWRARSRKPRRGCGIWARCNQAGPLLEEALAAAARCGNRAREGLSRGILGTVLGPGSRRLPTALVRCEQLRDDWPGDMLPGVEIGLGLLKLQAGDQTEGLRRLRGGGDPQSRAWASRDPVWKDG